MSSSINAQGAALMTMGADESGFPLAAIYRTVHGRRLKTTVTVVNEDDTDPPSSIPPKYESVESEAIVSAATEPLDIERTQEIQIEDDASEHAVRGAVELLKRLVVGDGLTIGQRIGTPHGAWLAGRGTWRRDFGGLCLGRCGLGCCGLGCLRLGRFGLRSRRGL